MSFSMSNMNELSFFSQVDQDVKSKSSPVCSYYCDTEYLLLFYLCQSATGYCSLSTCQDTGFFCLSFERLLCVEDDVCLDSEFDSKLAIGECAKSEIKLLDLYIFWLWSDVYWPVPWCTFGQCQSCYSKFLFLNLFYVNLLTSIE